MYASVQVLLFVIWATTYRPFPWFVIVATVHMSKLSFHSQIPRKTQVTKARGNRAVKFNPNAVVN